MCKNFTRRLCASTCGRTCADTGTGRGSLSGRWRGSWGCPAPLTPTTRQGRPPPARWICSPLPSCTGCRWRSSSGPDSPKRKRLAVGPGVWPALLGDREDHPQRGGSVHPGPAVPGAGGGALPALTRPKENAWPWDQALFYVSMYSRTKKSAPMDSHRARQASISSLGMVLTTVMRTWGTLSTAMAVNFKMAGSACRPYLL